MLKLGLATSKTSTVATTLVHRGLYFEVVIPKVVPKATLAAKPVVAKPNV